MQNKITLTLSERKFLRAILLIFTGKDYYVWTIEDECGFHEGILIYLGMLNGDAEGAYDGILCEELCKEFEKLFDEVCKFATVPYDELKPQAQKRVLGIMKRYDKIIRRLYSKKLGKELATSIFKDAEKALLAPGPSTPYYP